MWHPWRRLGRARTLLNATAPRVLAALLSTHDSSGKGDSRGAVALISAARIDQRPRKESLTSKEYLKDV